MLCVFQMAIWGCCMKEGIVFKQCSGDDMYDVCVSDGNMEMLYERGDSVQAVCRR